MKLDLAYIRKLHDSTLQFTIALGAQESAIQSALHDLSLNRPAWQRSLDEWRTGRAVGAILCLPSDSKHAPASKGKILCYQCQYD